MNYLKLGTILKTRGLKGDVKVYSTSDFAPIRYKKGSHVFLKKDETVLEVEVLHYSSDGKFDYLTFKNYETIEAITPYLSYDIVIIKEESSLPKGFYYHDDLMNCTLFENDIEIATVKSVEEYASYKSLRIVFKKNNKEFLLPFIAKFIKKVDIENKRIDVELIKGMDE